jgi:hypothetical protein
MLHLKSQTVTTKAVVKQKSTPNLSPLPADKFYAGVKIK